MIETIAFVFARGGSKGLSKKNILEIEGIPLIGYSLLLASKITDITYVSTDCNEIAAISKDFGARIIERPAELSTDTSPEWAAWKHAVNYVLKEQGAFKKFLSLPSTSPLRTKENVLSCLGELQGNVDIVLTVTPSKRNPFFNMVKFTSDNSIKMISEENRFTRRQDAPSCFDITTVAYAARPEYIINANNLWEGNVKATIIPEKNALDIDNKYDFEIASLIIKEKNALLKSNKT